MPDLPIDPRYPSQRLDFLLSDAAPGLVLTDAETAQTLPAHGVPCCYLQALDLEDGGGKDTDDDPVRSLRPDHLAYLMYTSGSTGTPKGVAITHANVVNGVSRLVEMAGSRGRVCWPGLRSISTCRSWRCSPH
ncbi:AMP-binding protein [Streptomyces sp. NPDC005393]|uniref:AMP-binding protein n=1 Tax=Streptomyces sp. NPDC005393 TaxID=3157041 RepID=UPI0033A44502